MTALAALYFFDALVLGQGFVAAALFAIVLFGLVPKWLLLRHIGAATRPTARLALSLFLCASAIMLTINGNSLVARERATAVVSAVYHYRALAGHFPHALPELIPTYIERIPRAKYTLGFNQFDYANVHGRVILSYVDVPPFGRAVFDFAAERWHRVAYSTLIGQTP